MNQGLKINFQPLYCVAHFMAITMLILIPLQIIIYVISPPPDTVKGFFELYQQNPFLGLLSLDFLYLFSNMTIVIIYVALFVLLYREKPVTVPVTGLKLGHLDVKKLVFLCLSRKSLLKPVTFTVNVQYVCIMG